VGIATLQPQIDADERRSRTNAKTERILAAAFQVSNVLGCGFLEKVYENALAYELTKQGFRVQQQWPINVHYDNTVVGQYVADLLLDEEVLVEIKAIKCFDDIHVAQCMNYLKATGKTICLLLNFGAPRVEIKRIVNNFDPNYILLLLSAFIRVHLRFQTIVTFRYR
jgi:GxxExxY protein